MKTWLAAPAGGDTVRLIPVEGNGPDVFCKALDAKAEIAELKADRDSHFADFLKLLDQIQVVAAERDSRKAENERLRAALNAVVDTHGRLFPHHVALLIAQALEHKP